MAILLLHLKIKQIVNVVYVMLHFYIFKAGMSMCP